MFNKRIEPIYSVSYKPHFVSLTSHVFMFTPINTPTIIRVKYLLLFLCVSAFHLSYAQEPHRLSISLKNSCSYIQAPDTGRLYAFNSSGEALEIVNKICKIDGIDPNFVVNAANVANAKAVMDNNVRYILYSESFIQEINLLSHTNWAGVSILAHEIGHHLNGHTLEENATRPELELGADKFSGFILKKLGASLEDAQMAVKTLCPNDVTDMYPPKSARLEAIAVGWKSAESNTPSPPGMDQGASKSAKPIYSSENNVLSVNPQKKGIDKIYPPDLSVSNLDIHKNYKIEVSIKANEDLSEINVDSLYAMGIVWNVTHENDEMLMNSFAGMVAFSRDSCSAVVSSYDSSALINIPETFSFDKNALKDFIKITIIKEDAIFKIFLNNLEISKIAIDDKKLVSPAIYILTHNLTKVQIKDFKIYQ